MNTTLIGELIKEQPPMDWIIAIIVSIALFIIIRGFITGRISKGDLFNDNEDE